MSFQNEPKSPMIYGALPWESQESEICNNGMLYFGWTLACEINVNIPSPALHLLAFCQYIFTFCSGAYTWLLKLYNREGNAHV